jgi:4-hydroxy-tetrahydrodipicolinate synthase
MRIGAGVAVITPFKNGKVDYETFGKVIERLIEKGIHSIVPCGTTGESATLSNTEHEEVIRFTVEKVNKRVPVIAGAGSNSTAEAINLTKFAKKVGADAALSITPYYNKPTQEGLYEHFKAISESEDIPIVLYNVPGRTSVNMLAPTVARLAELKNIIAVKEASGNLTQISTIVSLCPESFSVISGEDAIVFPTLAVGGKGTISVAANIVPDKVAKMIEEFEAGNFDGSRKIQLELLPLIDALFFETNPTPVKTAAELMGISSSELRLPLVPMSKRNKEIMIGIMKQMNLL